MLRVENLCFAYPGGPEFSFSMTLERGEIVTLSGDSGSGKSTLIDLICGFLTPLSGDILWDGKSILGLAPANRPVSALFQSGELFDHDGNSPRLLGLCAAREQGQGDHDGRTDAGFHDPRKSDHQLLPSGWQRRHSAL